MHAWISTFKHKHSPLHTRRKASPIHGTAPMPQRRLIFPTIPKVDPVGREKCTVRAASTAIDIPLERPSQLSLHRIYSLAVFRLGQKCCILCPTNITYIKGRMNHYSRYSYDHLVPQGKGGDAMRCGQDMLLGCCKFRNSRKERKKDVPVTLFNSNNDHS